MSDAPELSDRLKELRERASADYKQETGAWSQYHHALQAAYERGGLVPAGLVAEKVREAIERHCRHHWPHVRVEGLLIETHEWSEMPEHMEGSA